MAKLPDEIITTVFTLQRQLLERIDEATATVFVILDRYGETDATIPELDESPEYPRTGRELLLAFLCHVAANL